MAGQGTTADTGTAQAEGGIEMASGSKPDARIAATGLPESRLERSKPHRANGWRAAPAVALAAALVGVGTLVILDLARNETPATRRSLPGEQSQLERVVTSGGQPEVFGHFAAAGYDEVWATDSTGNADVMTARVWRLKGGTWTSVSKAPGALVDIAVGPDGAVWATMEPSYRGREVARFDGSSWENVASGRDLVVAFGPDGRTWTASGTTIQPVGGEALPGPVPLRLSVSQLGVGPGGEVWAACWRFWGGESCGLTLAHFDGRAWETVEPPPTAGAPWLFDLEVTSQGDVWIAAGVEAGDRLTQVLFLYRGGTWTEFREADMGLGFDAAALNGLASLDSTQDGTLLLLTRGGVAAFRDDSWSPVVEGKFGSLSVAPDDTIWLTSSWDRFPGDALYRLAAP